MVFINEDLVKERKKCDFDIEEMIHFIDGSKEVTIARRKLDTKILENEGFRDAIPSEYMSHKDKTENVMRKLNLLIHVLADFLVENGELFTYVFTPSKVFKCCNAVVKDSSPLLGHYGMFLPTIFSQATSEQQKAWVRPGSRIFGCYAQTELGHGSNIKSLETTATYDPSTEEFVLNSPALTSYKWWPGGLGNIANHCILIAQLHINGTNYGIHSFFVQLRDLDTHMPLPGVKVGEIGPKLDIQALNHGFLGLQNYRIPRNNMLMKYSQVLKDGTYVKPSTDKLMYSTMVLARTMIITDISYELARASTIAIRYSAVRRQSHIKPDAPEVQILDFVTQQHKVFIALATSHAYRVVGKWLWRIYTAITQDINKGNFERLPEFHALSCCLKAVSSREGTAFVEQCRLACGGHGHMMSSNLPTIYALATCGVTYDGEYTVLLLQTARYLIKVYKGVAEGKGISASTTSYLEKFSNDKYVHKWRNTPDGIIEGFQAVTAGKIKEAYASITRQLKLGKSYEEAWNLSSIKLTATSEAHARTIFCDYFWRETQVKLMSVSSPVRAVLQQLAELYLTYFALESQGDFLLYSNISREDIDLLRERYEGLLAEIRPNAVGLVDSFDFRDEILGSTLGAFDGRVYERLMEEAEKSPVNAEPPTQSFQQYLKPMFMKAKL